MYQTFYQQKKPFWVRYTVLILIFAIILGCFAVRLSDLQVVNAARYRAQGDNASVRTLTVPAIRGEIVDRYGRVLVYNREGYNVVFDAAELPSGKTNSTVLKMIKLMKKCDGEWVDRLPMQLAAPYTFTEDSESDVKMLLEKLGLARYATARNCFDAMVTRYSLEGMSESEQRAVMGVRYTMELGDFSVVNPFVFAEDVNSAVIQAVQEYNFELTGVKVETATFREYTDPELAPHVLGYTGLMSATDWEKYKETGEYRYSDKVGKAGIEMAAQDYLKGVDGKVEVVQNADGTIVSSKTVRETVSGSTVQLTIDAKLQKKAQTALADAINKINTSGGNALSGALVVTRISDGDVLASANYPSYSMTDYLDDYESVRSAPGQPLFDRALNGQYPPGSTFKPAVALIGLQLGKIGRYDTITCLHTYKRFQDYQPSCLGWHGSLNISTALAYSCNYFFYELGHRIGITDLNKYCRQMGLGESTGIELPSSAGILAGKDYREKIGSYWTQGDTIQAAIGQSDNAFTPIQLAMYTSTIANSGVRQKAHFIKSVHNYTMSETVKDDFTEVLGTTEISPENFDAVRSGMLSVTEDGTVSNTFRNYPIKVAGKTGTADAPGNKTNAVFIAFAPYNDPEIAISIVIENGGHGASIAYVAKELFDAYFFNSEEPYSEQPVGRLLP